MCTAPAAPRRAGAAGGDGEEWLLLFLGVMDGVKKAGAFFFPGDARRAQQASQVLAFLSEGLYRGNMAPAHQPMPLSLTVSTTSKRLLRWGRPHPATGALGHVGSEACAAALASAGLNVEGLYARPRRMLEVHLADLGRAAVLVLPHERGLLLGGGVSGPASQPVWISD